MTETAHDLVQRGAALLDSKLPGWADQIDLDTLEMSNGCRCVLGQLGGRQVNLDLLGEIHDGITPLDPYINAASRLFALDDESEINHGFLADWVSYAELQDSWKQEIVARRTLDAQ